MEPSFYKAALQPEQGVALQKVETATILINYALPFT